MFINSGMGEKVHYAAQREDCHKVEAICVGRTKLRTKMKFPARSLLSAATEYSRGNWYLQSHTLPAFVLAATSTYLIESVLHAGDHATCTDTLT